MHARTPASGSRLPFTRLLVLRLLRGEGEQGAHVRASEHAVELASVPKFRVVQRARIASARAVLERLRDVQTVGEAGVAPADGLRGAALQRRPLGHEDRHLLPDLVALGDPDVVPLVLVDEGDQAVLRHALGHDHQHLLVQLALLELVQVRLRPRHALVAGTRQGGNLEGFPLVVLLILRQLGQLRAARLRLRGAVVERLGLGLAPGPGGSLCGLVIGLGRRELLGGRGVEADLEDGRQGDGLLSVPGRLLGLRLPGRLRVVRQAS
mmetsp:Transcript_27072/g.84219  ORF Transcript_27072/g.84219 Transcript_27072/m.84219 type:complete len:266 (-) Transcript_27072:134-931(-)